MNEIQTCFHHSLFTQLKCALWHWIRRQWNKKERMKTKNLRFISSVSTLSWILLFYMTCNRMHPHWCLFDAFHIALIKIIYTIFRAWIWTHFCTMFNNYQFLLWEETSIRKRCYSVCQRYRCNRILFLI